MKKAIVYALIIISIILSYFIYNFYNKNLSGADPAILSPKNKITKNTTDLPLTIPEGYTLSIFADNLGAPRDLLMDPQNNLLASITKEGRVVVIKNNETKNLLTNLNRPHGLEINCENNSCTLYIAESDAVYTYSYNPNDQSISNKQKIIDLPNGGSHFTRSLLIKDGKLYTSIGSACNVCYEINPQRAKILQSNLDGTDLKEFATGLRNSVFMTVHPKTKDIWATEMSRDLLGDNTPPDEINIIESTKDYGWPICFGKNIHDTSFDQALYQLDTGTTVCDALGKTPSHIDLQAHSAPLGLAFLDNHNLLVAYHGSWNRTIPTGYKIVKLTLDKNYNLEKREDFLTHAPQSNNESLGRPVDILIHNGKIFISDDKAGIIYLLES